MKKPTVICARRYQFLANLFNMFQLLEVFIKKLKLMPIGLQKIVVQERTLSSTHLYNGVNVIKGRHIM